LTGVSADAVLAAIIAFAGKVGSAVIVEGIETEAMLTYVRDAGADYAQGYLLGKPSETLPVLAAMPQALSA
jgi:EAL domain-containing protein (putative c-di-GMP-specific phosphodiesterase class I)